MNKAIIDNDVLGTKAAQEAKFAEFAQKAEQYRLCGGSEEDR